MGRRAHARTQTGERTWRRRVLGLEQADDALAVQAAGAQQHRLGAPAAPAHHREAVLAVAAGDTLQGVVLDALGDDQQPRVAVRSQTCQSEAARDTARPCPQPPRLSPHARHLAGAGARLLSGRSPAADGIHAVHGGDPEGLGFGAAQAAAQCAQPQTLVVPAARPLHQAAHGHAIRGLQGRGRGQRAGLQLLRH